MTIYGISLSKRLRSCFEFLQKVFLGLMYPFSCVLWAIFRQIARYLPHHRSENASKTHPKSSHDKFKTASKNINRFLRQLHNRPFPEGHSSASHIAGRDD